MVKNLKPKTLAGEKLIMCHCPGCKTAFWRSKEQLAQEEKCGVCLKLVKMVEKIPVKKSAKKNVARGK